MGDIAMYDITSMHLSIRDSYDAFSIKYLSRVLLIPPSSELIKNFKKE
jgi:hypothetical protein